MSWCLEGIYFDFCEFFLQQIVQVSVHSSGPLFGSHSAAGAEGRGASFFLCDVEQVDVA